MLVLMLALFLVLELLRGARFRTTVWTVTSDGVECVRGLFALRPCFRLPLAAVRRVELPDGDPELLTDEGPVRLEGVGAACLPALLRALPDAEHGITEPEILAKGRSRRRDVAFAVALILLLTLVQVVRLHERGTRQAASFLLKVRKAVDAARWDTQRELERLSSKEVAGGVHAVGSESTPGTAEFDVKLYWLAPGQGFRLGHHPDRPIQVSGVAVDVSVRADHHHGMFPDSPTIELATGTATNNDIFVNELRTALEEAGLPTPRITTTPVGPAPGK